MWVAAIFEEVTNIGQHLALFRNARVQSGAVHDLAERIALRQRTEREFQIEWPSGVTIGLENRSVEKQAILGRHFAGLQREQTGGNIHWIHLELIGADDERVTLFGL